MVPLVTYPRRIVVDRSIMIIGFKISRKREVIPEHEKLTWIESHKKKIIEG